MKRKLLLSLFLLSLSVFLKDITFADHQDDSPSIKRYKRISMVESEKATLSWVAEDKVDTSKLLNTSRGSDRLEVLSENEDLGILLLDDKSGNNIVVIQGEGELLLLTYSKGDVEKPYKLLEFKVEDNIISTDQFYYVKSLITARV